MKYVITRRKRINWDKYKRPLLLVLAGLIVYSTFSNVLYRWLESAHYDLEPAVESLLSENQVQYGPLFELDKEQEVYNYNLGYQPSPEIATDNSSSKFRARFFVDPAEGIEIGDAVYDTDIKLKPQFDLHKPEQRQGRVIYPLLGDDGYKVISMSEQGYKEDIILEEYSGDTASFSYELELPAGLEARIEQDGSLGVYGVDSRLLGDISTGSEEDKKLLEEARRNGEKNLLLFSSPAPFILEGDRDLSPARAWYSLDGNILTVHAAGLDQAAYPISIDPSIYVETAAKLMRGNNESNIDFDVSNELIQKGFTTGARFDAWETTGVTALNSARWNHGTAVAGGYVYTVGGSDGSTNQSDVYWAEFNPSNFTVGSPNPGDGACSGWCTDSAYDLPEARAGLSLVAYNGFLYAIGGEDGSGTRQDTVYIAKLGANGEPALWHPTDTNKDNWVYWYESGNNLSSARSYLDAAAYNNRIYVLGGDTSGGPVDTVEFAEFDPTGDVEAWSTTGMQSLPSDRYGHSVEVYNERMYLIGGHNGSAMQNSAHWIKLDTDGTMDGSWNATSSFSDGRIGWGGKFTTVWGGYIYLAGGCSAINGSGYCTAIEDDIQLASINADGTLADWNTIIGLTSSRMGYGLTAWRNNLYGVGGCSTQNTTTGACSSTLTTVNRGEINQDGDASTISNSVDIGSGVCSGSDPYNCDLPPIGDGNGEGGHMSGGTVINNGYVYYIGGCYQVGGSNVCHTGNNGRATDNVYYSAIAADGTLHRPASCTGGGVQYAGAWCVDNGNTLPTAVAAMGITVFNNTIYVVGGTTGSVWQDNVWRTSLNADGSLNTWSTQSFSDLDLGDAKGYSYVFARANPNSADTYPANLYVIGGCGAGNANGLDCSDEQFTEVYKCNITTSGALETANSDDCTTSGQLQIDAEPGTAGSQGLGAMAGAVYANYIYLIGGQSPNESERDQVIYAQIDDNNDIVAVSGSNWVTSPNVMSPERRRNTAFGYNGYLYAIAGYSEGTELQDLLFAKIDVTDGSIGSFNESQVTVNPRWDVRAIVNNGYVYTLGGCSSGTAPATCDAMDDTVQVFQLYNNWSGSPASYGASANLFGNGSESTSDRIGASAAVLDGYLYIAGGCISSSDCTNATDDVQYASIDASSGALGSWSAASNILPADRAWGQLEVAGGNLYYLGGQNDTATNEQSTVYYADTFSSGDITASWSTASGGIGDTASQAAQPRTKFGATVWNDRIYVVGGIDGSGSTTNTVFISPQLPNGGDIAADSWSSDGDTFEVARSGHAVIAYANNLYVLGGHTGSDYLFDVQFTQINSDGSLDPWSYTTSLPLYLRGTDGFAANGFMYLFGGRSADTTCDSKTIVAPISANTSIASGNNPTGLGEWYETNEKYSGDRYGASAVYHEGKAYVLGGGCGSTLTYTGSDRVVQSTLQSQPQIARYSRLIDTDTDVFPTRWLLNGLDNSIGAKWHLSYRSSTDATRAWGEETFFGEVTLGNVEDYTPLDSGGTDTEFARFYYFSITIDSSRAYGYPDDVTRGPTIDDLTLFFTSDPSKRLRHGKTFTGGLQQPLDTPPGP